MASLLCRRLRDSVTTQGLTEGSTNMDLARRKRTPKQGQYDGGFVKWQLAPLRSNTTTSLVIVPPIETSPQRCDAPLTWGRYVVLCIVTHCFWITQSG